MGLYEKCRNVGERIQRQGISGTLHYYRTRKKEQKKILQKIQESHLLSEKDLEEQRKEKLESRPLISILTPLYNTSETYLEQLLNSVQRQTYENWELCLADGSDDAHSSVGEICKRYARTDSRIRYQKLEKNEGIVGNTNRCLELASGSYYGLLDHDDLLHASALYEVVKVISAGADFVYTDEMKFRDSIEDSADIVCKNGFGKDELRSHNYICHFVVFKKSLLDGMDVLYREVCEGSQDYDMVLRLTEKAEHIVHIPKILYYWRVHPGSVSMNLSGKQYAVDAAQRAIADQLERCQEPGQVACNYPYETIYRMKYILKEHPLVSVILWGDKEKKELEPYIRTLLLKTAYRPLEIVLPEKQYEQYGRDGVSAISGDTQVAVSVRPTGEYLLYLNENCKPVNASWIEELLMFAQREDVGVVGPHIMYRNQQTYFAGAVLDRDIPSGIHVVNQNLEAKDQGYEANMKHVRNTSILTMQCMMVSRKLYEDLGGFDLRMGDCKDADFCLRSRRKGKNNVWTCFSSVYYSGKGTPETIWTMCKEFRKTWEAALREGDEYYPPLLKELKWL
ncbi:MAG: glycosyltransferase [Hespellia sp.]|nr:glycosyltransferase [Hespellia sp.]